MNSPPVARGSQEARFTQHRAHLLADPCISNLNCRVTNYISGILCLTGAGISTESGIPDYRSEDVGLYATSNHKPTQFQVDRTPLHLRSGTALIICTCHRTLSNIRHIEKHIGRGVSSVGLEIPLCSRTRRTWSSSGGKTTAQLDTLSHR